MHTANGVFSASPAVRRTVEEAAALLQVHVPCNVIDLLLYLFCTVLDGRNEVVADGVQRALDHQPRDFNAYVQRTAATGVGGRVR